jgi:hypothetical protein
VVGVVFAAGDGDVVDLGGPRAGVPGAVGEVADRVAELLADGPVSDPGCGLLSGQLHHLLAARRHLHHHRHLQRRHQLRRLGRHGAAGREKTPTTTSTNGPQQYRRASQNGSSAVPVARPIEQPVGCLTVSCGYACAALGYTWFRSSLKQPDNDVFVA